MAQNVMNKGEKMVDESFSESTSEFIKDWGKLIKKYNVSPENIYITNMKDVWRLQYFKIGQVEGTRFLSVGFNMPECECCKEKKEKK